jgi:hypothetical protein
MMIGIHAEQQPEAAKIQKIAVILAVFEKGVLGRMRGGQVARA